MNHRHAVAARLLAGGDGNVAPVLDATLGALAGQPGRYGPIRMWGSVGFVGAVLAAITVLLATSDDHPIASAGFAEKFPATVSTPEYSRFF